MAFQTSFVDIPVHFKGRLEEDFHFKIHSTQKDPLLVCGAFNNWNIDRSSESHHSPTIDAENLTKKWSQNSLFPTDMDISKASNFQVGVVS